MAELSGANIADMKAGWIERIGDFISSILLMILTLALIAAYGFLFELFRPAAIEVRPAAVEHRERSELQLSFQSPDR